jgi:hypothetical protein
MAPEEKSDNPDSLRLLAWTTSAAWVDRLQGYNWMTTTTTTTDASPASSFPSLSSSGGSNKIESSSSKSLGSASHLCALIRLASGEWRIQLGYRLTEREEEVNAYPSLPSAEEQRAGIIQATSQILAALVSYLSQIAEDMEDAKKRSQQSLSPEALLHLRDSLEDTLQATSNYLYQLAKLPSKPRLNGEDSVCIQLLGTLLTEFDIFDAQANLNTDEILLGLSFAMANVTDSRAQEQIITSLTGIMEMARDDSYRILLLKEHKLMEDNMVSFLQKYWTNSMSASRSNLPSIPLACRLTELWFSILLENMSELRIQIDPPPLTRGIIQWIRHTLDERQKSDSTTVSKQELLQALNAAVGCYVTLHGPTPPDESEGHVLQQALQFCSVHCP